MNAAERQTYRSIIAKGLRDSGRKFLAPSTWEWFVAAHAEGCRKIEAGHRPDLTGSELLRLMPLYDGCDKMRHRATRNRWVAHCVRGNVMVRVVGIVRVRTVLDDAEWGFRKLAVAHNPEEMRRAAVRQDDKMLQEYRQLRRFHGGVKRTRVQALEWTWRFLFGPEI